MSFDDAMNTMLPPSGFVSAHVTGSYGENRGSRNHGGVDFNYHGGQTGLNRTSPPVFSPVEGFVQHAGGGYGRVSIENNVDGTVHEILHLETVAVSRGQYIYIGTKIGTMGGRGPQGSSQYSVHVHYQIRSFRGATGTVDPQQYWRDKVPLGQ